MRTREGAGLRLRHSIRTHAAGAAGAAAAGAACREHLDLTNKNFHQRKAFFKATLSSQSFGSTKGKTKKPPTMVRQKQNKKTKQTKSRPQWCDSSKTKKQVDPKSMWSGPEHRGSTPFVPTTPVASLHYCTYHSCSGAVALVVLHGSLWPWFGRARWDSSGRTNRIKKKNILNRWDSTGSLSWTPDFNVEHQLSSFNHGIHWPLALQDCTIPGGALCTGNGSPSQPLSQCCQWSQSVLSIQIDRHDSVILTSRQSMCLVFFWTTLSKASTFLQENQIESCSG